MKNWINKFRDYPIFFISPDIKRGLGLERILPDFHLICSYPDPLIPVLREDNARIFCLSEKSAENRKIPDNSSHILENNLVQKYIKNKSVSNPCISFFKPSIKLDYLLKKFKFTPLVNSFQKNEKFENKIKFSRDFSAVIPQFILPFEIFRLNDLNFSHAVKKFGLPFCLQFGHGWAGKTTFFIKSVPQLSGLKKKYPATPVKVTRVVNGYTVLNNCCLYKNQVLQSSPAIQINGFDILSDKVNVTCGRQWPAEFLDWKMLDKIKKITQKVGKQMSLSGYKGFFGLDFLIDGKNGEIFISEINARLTASAPFYTFLETGENMIPLLAYHFASFLNIDLPASFSDAPVEGSQIIIRKKTTSERLKLKDFANYQLVNHRPDLLDEIYHPGNLRPGKFIFHREIQQRKDAESARIETKMKALSAPDKLAEWLHSLLNDKMLY